MHSKKEESTNNNIKNIESENSMNNKTLNENKIAESQITNNINNINIVNMIIEKDQRKLSEDSFEINNSILKEDENNQIKENNKNTNYLYSSKKSSQISDENKTKNESNLDEVKIKKFLEFENKYKISEKNEKEIYKYIYTYNNLHQNDKINPIIYYILKNSLKKKSSINKENFYTNRELKYTPIKDDNNLEFETCNINTADTLKLKLNIYKKHKEKVELKSKENSHNIIKNNNKENSNQISSNMKINKQSSLIKMQKSKKQKLIFKNDEELINFVKTKFKEKNGYYLMELKSKSFISNLDQTEKDKKNLDKIDINININKLKDDNNNLKSRIIKLKKDLEQKENDVKPLKEKNNQLKDEIIKKDSLIKKYEIKINENQKIIQNLKKNLSENTNNINKTKNNKNLSLCREIELNLMNIKTKISEISKMIQIEKNINFFFEKIKQKKIFDDNLSVLNIQNIYFCHSETDKKPKMKANIFSIIKVNDIFIKMNRKKNMLAKLNNSFSKISLVNICFLGIMKKREFNSNLENEKNITLKFDGILSSLNNIKNFKFINISKENNFNIYFKKNKIEKKNLEIKRNNNIFIQNNSEERIIWENLIVETIFNFHLEKLKLSKCFEIDKLALKSTNEIFYKSNKKNLIFEINKIVNFEFTHQEINKVKIFSIEKSNLISFYSLNKFLILSVSKPEIINYKNIKKNINNIIQILTLEKFSYTGNINIIKKFRNLLISNNNVSFSLKCKKQQTIHQNIQQIQENKSINNTLNNPKIENKNPNPPINLNNNNNMPTSNVKSEQNEDKYLEEDFEKYNKSRRLTKAMDRIRKRTQTQGKNSRPNFFQFQNKINNKENYEYKQSGKIMEIAKKLERQMTKGEDNTENEIKEEENTNSNDILNIISKQKIIKKKKKSKVDFNDYI